MPDRDSVAGNARLLRGLIWAGVLLAPMAAVVVLLGHNSNSVRFAVLLIAVAVVLIGATMLVRSDPELGRMDVEDRVADEVARLRRELRAEFGPQRAAVVPPRAGTAAVAPPRAAAAVVVPQRGAAAVPPPPEEESGFFADAPPMYPEDDPFGVGDFPQPADDYPMEPAGPMQPAGPMHSAGPMQSGGPMRPMGPMPQVGPMSQPGPVHQAGPVPQAGQPSVGTARPPGPGRPTGGRAGVPVASAAVRPPARTGPGMTTGGRKIDNPPVREPGTSTGGRKIAAAAVPQPPAPQIPRQRGAASVPPPGQPPRAAASVRPGGPFGPPESLAEDFGASNGYAAQVPAVYGAPAAGNTYGAAPNTYGAPADYSFDSDEYSGYGAPNYDGDQADGGHAGYRPAGGDQAGYGPTDGDQAGYAGGYGQAGYDADYGQGNYDQADYDRSDYGQADHDRPDHGYDNDGYADGGYAGGYGQDAPREPGLTTGDPSYKARRHRPSANDTNIGSLSDFAEYGGFPADEPDERYVQGQAPPRGRY